MAINNPKTLAFYEGVRGWPSHYTFIPEGMVSLNNRFFSYRDGQIWEHNISPDETFTDRLGVDYTVPRNQFYNDAFTTDPNSPSQSKPSIVQFIFNEAHNTMKNFKTISYQGSGQWSLNVSTDEESIQLSNDEVPEVWSVSGTVANDEWVEKEGKQHAYIRGVNATSPDLRNITIQGIGQGDVASSTSTVTFSKPLESTLSVGDELYRFGNTGTAEVPVYASTMSFVGAVTAIDGNTLTYSTTTRPDGTTIATAGTNPNDNDFFIFSKDRVSETSGLLGFYAICTMTNTDNTEEAELFLVETEIFRSSD